MAGTGGNNDGIELPFDTSVGAAEAEPAIDAAVCDLDAAAALDSGRLAA